MSLLGKLLSTGLLIILMSLLAAIAGAVVHGIILGLKIDSLAHARAPWSTVTKLGRLLALLVGLGMLAAMIAFFFNGILVTWNVKCKGGLTDGPQLRAEAALRSHSRGRRPDAVRAERGQGLSHGDG